MNQNVNHDVRGTRPCLRHIVSTMCLVIPCPRFLFVCNVCLMFTKTSEKTRRARKNDGSLSSFQVQNAC